MSEEIKPIVRRFNEVMSPASLLLYCWWYRTWCHSPEDYFLRAHESWQSIDL